MKIKDVYTYACPLENTAFPLCQGCPFFTEEHGTFWCHLASKNFCYDKAVSDVGVFPMIFPSEVHKAELRYVMENGEKVVQLNVGDLEGTTETAQDNVSDVMSAIVMDTLPRFSKRKKATLTGKKSRV